MSNRSGWNRFRNTNTEVGADWDPIALADAAKGAARNRLITWYNKVGHEKMTSEQFTKWLQQKMAAYDVEKAHLVAQAAATDVK